MNWYNEIDPFAAQWMRNLMDAGQIAEGIVDERSIEDVYPDDVAGYEQCHFFGGIGVWSYALRQAGWPDDRAVWTGSCPCQGFSAAGKRKGFADNRHLWPAWFYLISQCRPPVIFGEQVASKDGLAWINIIQNDLESIGYAFGAVDIPACGFGAPHKRNRLYFVAYARCTGNELLLRYPEAYGTARKTEAEIRERERSGSDDRSSSPVSLVANTEHSERWEMPAGRDDCNGQETGRDEGAGLFGEHRETGGMGDSESECNWIDANRERQSSEGRRDSGSTGETCQLGNAPDEPERPGPTNGFWSDAEWIWCRDGKYRAVGPGIPPLVVGNARHAKLQGRDRATEDQDEMGSELEYAEPSSPSGRSVKSSPLALPDGIAPSLGCGCDPDASPEARVQRLRAYGNAIVAPQAIEFIHAALGAIGVKCTPTR